ncbi:hypothetical protein C8R46DRAFT_1093461 [Mycena filopes]|nr:hypothetical protein C8R46DRAFT_1093461 [Mycena filopes]
MSLPTAQIDPFAPAVKMPLPGDPTAPHFGGRAAEIGPFLGHYERLLAKNNIQDSIAQCEEILQYCTPNVRPFVRGCPSFHVHDWVALKGELLKWYGPEPPIPRLVAQEHARRACRKPISTIAQWKRYYRSYCAAVGELHNTQQLKTSDFWRFFWDGIHPELRADLASQLQWLHPKPKQAQAWPIDEVCRVARQHLTDERITANTFGSRKGIDHTGAETDSEDDSSQGRSGSESS